LPEINSLYGVFNFLLFQALACLAVASHLRTMLTDPVCYYKLFFLFISNGIALWIQLL
jgi:hypothetical protein